MRPALFVTASLPRHWYTDGWSAYLCVVALGGLDVIFVELPDRLTMIVDGCLVAVVCVVRRVVVVAIYDGFARFADFDIACLTEHLTGYDRGAF